MRKDVYVNVVEGEIPESGCEGSGSGDVVELVK